MGESRRDEAPAERGENRRIREPGIAYTQVESRGSHGAIVSRLRCLLSASARSLFAVCSCVLTEELGPVGLHNTASSRDELGDGVGGDGEFGVVQDQRGHGDQQLLLLRRSHV